MKALNSSFRLEADGGSGIFLPFLAGCLALLLALQALSTVLAARERVQLRVIRMAPVAVLLGGLIGLVVLLWPSAPSPAVRVSLVGLQKAHALSLGFSLDRLAALMVALVGVLGWAVLKFSATYLRGEKHRGRFLGWLLSTIVLVQLFALQTSLIGHGILWLFISISVHKLLRHYDDRPRARLAAKKKFLTSRFADVAFYTALWLFYREFGTLDVAELSQVSESTGASELGAALLVLAALMKSAQLPFHSWLPDTMDAPTPVSAIMHAGVVNAGALLLFRNASLLSHHSGSLALLVLVGGASAAFGTLVGSVQPSVKLRLAYSTIAQMGFLFFELGLGLVGAAALHLAAHALYKAHAFLRSGTAQTRFQPSALGVLPLAASVGASIVFYGALFFVTSSFWGLDLVSYLPLGFVWAFGTSQYLLGPATTSVSSRLRNFLTVGLGMWALCFAVEVGFAHWLPRLPSFLSGGPLTIAATGMALGLLLITVFFGSSQQLRTSFLRRFYVHALSGFYFSELTDRATQKLWPDAAPSTTGQPVLPLTKVLS